MATHFLVELHVRENFLEDATDDEQAAAGEHFAYYTELHKHGKLLTAGRREDAKLGIAILKVDSLEAAQQLINADPAVIKGVFTAEVNPFNLALG